MRLGKLPPKFDSRNLRFGTYVTSSLPTPPDSVDYSKAVKDWPMMGNRDTGDCTIAAAGHMIQEWTANSQSNEIIISDDDILNAYRDFVGNDLHASLHMLDVLDYWQNTGIGGHRIVGYTQLEENNQIQVEDSIQLFSNCYIGLALPDFTLPPKRPSDSPDKHVADLLAIEWEVRSPKDSQNPKNGHCVPAVAYDQRYLYVVTWGSKKRMSWQFYFTYMDEAYAVLSWEWIKANPPSGFDFASLQLDLQKIGGPARIEIKPEVLAVLNNALPKDVPLPDGTRQIPNTLTAEKWNLATQCYLSDMVRMGLSGPLSEISTDQIYPHGLPISPPEAQALKTVGEAIDLTWNRARGQSHAPVKVGTAQT